MQVVGLLVGVMVVHVAHAETRVIPYITISERYDSNVFLADVSTSNVNPEDWVTSVIPQIAVLHRSPNFRGFVSGGATGEYYIKNNGLNYIGFNGTAGLDVSQIVQRHVPNATLQMSGSVIYTPLPPAFLRQDDSGQVDNPFVRGIQQFRTNTLTTTGSINGSYGLTQRTRLHLGYSYAHIQFGNTLGNLGQSSAVQTFDSTSHIGSGGLTYQLSQTDLVGVRYSYSFIDQTGIAPYGINTAGTTWTRVWSHDLSSTLSAGGTVYESIRNSEGREVIGPNRVFPNGSIAIKWRGWIRAYVHGGVEDIGGAAYPLSTSGVNLQTMSPSLGISGPSNAQARPGDVFGSLQYSVGVYPALSFVAGPTTSHVVGGAILYGLASRLTLNANANSGWNKAVSATTDFSYRSLEANVGLNYMLSSTLRAALNFGYGAYDGTNSGATFNFDRKVVLISLTKAFDSDFFSSLGIGVGMQDKDSKSEKNL